MEENHNITGRVSALETDMKNVVKALESVNDSLQNLNKQIHNSSKTNWSTLASWAAVIITMISCLGYLANQPVVNMLERERFTNLRQYDLLDKHVSDFQNERVRTSRVDQRLISLEKQINEIKSEQLRRTNKVYSK